MPFSRRMRNCSGHIVGQVSHGPRRRGVGDEDDRRSQPRGRDKRLLNTARHSSLLFSTGNDIVFEAEVPNRDVKDGNVGMNAFADRFDDDVNPNARRCPKLPSQKFRIPAVRIPLVMNSSPVIPVVKPRNMTSVCRSPRMRMER